MKIVLSWLADYLEMPSSITPDQLAAGLVQLGHEVDGIVTSGASFTQVVVGKVLSREPHPNADKLGVCMVDVGSAAPRQIVCGASNARAGIAVAVALPGAVLPGDFIIKQSKIREVLSDGMLCSVRELGLGDEHEGIWELGELATDKPAGTPLAMILPPPAVVLEVAVTPNRGDCLSHLGVARDLAALGLGTLKPLPEITLAEGTAFTIQAAVANNAAGAPACAQLNLLPLQGLTASAPSPQLVQQRLLAAGQRPKNALVDVTTYIMLALGQPLHAYDADKLAGDTLTAAFAQPEQPFVGLTGANATLNATDVIVTDASGAALGLAGILGGASTAIADTTTRVVLEAAVWNPVQIALSGQRHQIHTDAKARFERGIDPALSQYALRYAAQLLQQWAGGVVGSLKSAGAGGGAQNWAPEPIRYHPAFFMKYIGMSVADDKQRSILTALGFGVREIQAGWLLTPPTWRTYMGTPEDITEEILRVVGYESVPHVLPSVSPGQFGINGKIIELDRKARKALAGAGFLEAITYSFIGSAEAARFADGNANLLQLANPLAQTDMTTMRPSLLPGLLNAMAKNFASSDATPRLAEVGKVFRPKAEATGEALMAAGVLVATGGRHWQQAEAVPDARPDAFSAKGAAMALLEALGVPVSSGVVEATAPAHYHPGRSGTLSVGPFVLAHFGELHPALRAGYDLPNHAGPVAVFEVYLEPLLKLSSKARPWAEQAFPPVKRDLSVLVTETLPAATLLAAVAKASKGLPHNTQLQAEVFDRYSGKGVADGQVAIGLALTLQSPEKTLTEAEVQGMLVGVTQALAAVGATPRS